MGSGCASGPFVAASLGQGNHTTWAMALPRPAGTRRAAGSQDPPAAATGAGRVGASAGAYGGPPGELIDQVNTTAGRIAAAALGSEGVRAGWR